MLAVTGTALGWLKHPCVPRRRRLFVALMPWDAGHAQPARWGPPGGHWARSTRGGAPAHTPEPGPASSLGGQARRGRVDGARERRELPPVEGPWKVGLLPLPEGEAKNRM